MLSHFNACHTLQCTLKLLCGIFDNTTEDDHQNRGGGSSTPGVSAAQREDLLRRAKAQGVKGSWDIKGFPRVS